ncbi:eukaryotic peptide chain release factor GTP-binding subunit ERF3A-like isoform X2 [Tachypleus tridentatus]|uniref:eukaryotic peptide chain release factor GTP-binding subunit ERF3A-like isoform X2 n=1 Tax=Tachypleus tridentatus TaxID=6853 RepID=UPI003FD0D184
MENTLERQTAPDSWEQETMENDRGGSDDGLETSLSSLNVDAPPFVPSFAILAAAKAQLAEGDEGQLAPDPPPEKGNGESPEENTDEISGADEAPADWEEADVDETNNIETADDDESLEPQSTPKPKKKKSKDEQQRIRKEHVNIVFIGHVDAGKSTIGGQLLYLTGMVDKRTLEKYEREAKEKNRESWYLSWALDTNQEERDKGKTVEVGRAYFETEHKRFTLLDAPGHRSFVPNMIGGACQADLAVLVISARKGEFETGFERGGQTREHAMLAKTAGVKHLVILVNKMDDPTVEWAEDRFNECKEKLVPYLKKCGFNPKTDIYFIPCSGLTGAFLKDVLDEKLCPWYRGPSLLQYIENLPPLNRSVEGPFIMPVVDKYKDMGTVVLGKIESGAVKRGQQLILMPIRKLVEVLTLWMDEDEVNMVTSGDSVKIKLKGVEEEEVQSGFVLCDADNACTVGKIFDAQVVILEHKSIICPGYTAVLHLHATVEEVSVKAVPSP